ncbi:MAG: DUF1449 family protein, partial [Rhodospirillum sp.]|nr:DUF1449 family protein [Rhodospirillum sp.]
ILIGRVPLLMLLIVFLTAFGLFGFGIQTIAQSLFGAPLHGALASIPAVLFSLPVVRGFGRLFLRWFPSDLSDAPNREGLIGRVAVVFRGEARRGSPAEAKIKAKTKDGSGPTHYLLVEPDGEGTFLAGDEVLIVRRIGTHYAAIPNPHATLVALGLVFSRLYRRASKEVAFVRTGFGGQLVVLNGGALVFPVLHETIPVNMNTLRLEVNRSKQAALITRDRMRVDVTAEFYARVQPMADSISNAAQTLGMRTMNPEALRELIEGKFVDALRSVAAEMAMKDLHEQRVQFVQKVQQAVSEDLLKNGLELESVSLTGLDQTSREYFNPANAFDAEGLTKLAEEIEERRKKRNLIELDADVEIRRKALEASQRKLEIDREEEYARLRQQQEIAVRRAEQTAEIASREAESKQTAEQAAIASDEQVRRREVARSQALEAAEIEKKKAVELAEQDMAIAIAERSRAQSEAQAAADESRAKAVRAEEEVITVRESQGAERRKLVELVEARKEAERDAISIDVGASAEKAAAEDKAEAVRIMAQAEADRDMITAKTQAEAEKLRAAAAEVLYAVDAAGQRAMNESANTLNTEQVAMRIRMALIERLPEIIAESVKPMERIEGIKIVQVEGLTGGGGQ